MSSRIENEFSNEIETLTDTLIKPFFLKEQQIIFAEIKKIHKEYRFHQRELEYWINSEIFGIMNRFQSNYQQVYNQIAKKNSHNFLLKEWVNLFIHRTKNEIVESMILLKQDFFRVFRNKNERLRYRFPEINFDGLLWDSKNMRLEESDLNQLVGNFAFEFHNSRKRGSVAATVHLAEKTAIIPQIPRFTYETLEELMRNAKHFTDDSGEITITVSRSRTRTILLKVADNGIGIESQIQDKIFQGGFTTRVGGTGRGLSLIKVYVEEILGGTLSIQSTPGSGTTITLEMPTGDHIPKD